MTPKQKKILDYITSFTDDNGYAPSQQELASHFGFKSLGTVQHYLKLLGAQGYLQKSWNARRGVKVPEKGESFGIPLVGRVAAGRPIEAIEGHDTLEVPPFLMGKSGDHVVLKVHGESMIDEGILDGDFAVIRRQANAENGETVVALVDNEATIKKLRKRKGSVELLPANGAFKPIVVDESQHFQIYGILVGLVRKI